MTTHKISNADLVKAAALLGMVGIAGKEILGLRGVDAGNIRIDTDKAGLYPATASLASIDGKGTEIISADSTIPDAGVDVEKGVLSGNNLHYRSWAIYPTSDKHVWYQYAHQYAHRIGN